MMVSKTIDLGSNPSAPARYIIKYMNKKPAQSVIGFLQASGVALYITLFVSFVNLVESRSLFINVGPIGTGVVVLCAFVISALVCSSLVFAYPFSLFMSGEKKRAFFIVVWSAAWLLTILAVFLVAFFLRG